MINGDNHSELTSLDIVIKDTVKTLESGREQMFAVAENARNECSRLSSTLREIDEQINNIDSGFSDLDNNEKIARVRVKLVTNNFEQYSEDEIKSAFEGAKDLQVKLTRLVERRNQLEHKREELETSFTSLQKTAEKAENMISQVGVVMDFIKGNLKNINTKLESLQQRQLLGLQIIKAQEEERKRVAREIHDGPAQSMANVVLRMEFCEKLMDFEPEKVRQELKELKNIVKDNLQDVRKIIFDLRPMALDDLGVVPALKRYIENFRKTNNLHIETAFYGRAARLEPVLEIALFRLIQEALNNVLKHAAASNVRVTVDMKADMVKALVEDDGCGFELSDIVAGQQTSFGLISMKERIDLLGGELYIDTNPGKGTKISFEFPVKG